MGAYARFPYALAPGVLEGRTPLDVTPSTWADSCEQRKRTSRRWPAHVLDHQSVLWRFVAHAAMDALVGRAREVTTPTWILAAISCVLLVVEDR